ncbi:MAG: hypothetical protein FWG52_09040 [Proteobacteria bacterium]|nr:hypothetical protein [Pseudomonadota bacterium]
MNNFTLNALISMWVLLASSPSTAQASPSGNDNRETENAGPAPAVALNDASPVRFQFSGFGTLGMVYTDAKDLRFIRPSLSHSSSENPDFAPDTVIGVQGNLSLGQRASIVVQGISRKNTYNNYEPRATLAFASYAIAPFLTVRAGRMRMPFFMLSETSDINYANPWIRPPTEIYSLVPFNDLDGVDLLLSDNFGKWNVELHSYFGGSSAHIYQSGKGRLNGSGLDITATNGRLTLFAAHGEARMSMKWNDKDFQNLSSMLASPFVLNGDRILQDLSGDKGRARISSVAMQWDDTRWLLIAEYSCLRTTRYTPNAQAWEITAARRYGNFTPYLAFADFVRHRKNGTITSEKTGIPDLDAAVQAFTAPRNLGQSRATLGLRWDFYRNTALKLEYSRIRTKNNSWGSLFPTDLAKPRVENRRINTIGASVDVTF